MALIGIIIKVSTVTLFLAEAASVLNRLRSYNDKREARLFLIALLILFLKALFPDLPYFRELGTLVLIFIVKQYLVLILPYAREKIFNFAFAAMLFMNLAIIPTGVYGLIHYKLFFVFTCLILGVPVFLLMYRLFVKVGKRNLLVILVIALCLFFSSGLEQFVRIIPEPSLSLGGIFLLGMAAAIGHLLYEEAYFAVSSLRGLSARLTEEEKHSLEMSRRLVTTEESLIAQDRLISLGLLAGGLTHEFKNILSLISTSAQFGLRAEAPEKKHQSLALIQEHIEHSMNSVIRVLEQIKTNRHREPREIDIDEFLARIFKIIRANYRTQNIDIGLVVRDKFRARVRPDDLEQILLNLIRNAAAALLKNTALDRRTISLLTRVEGGTAAIEILDNAGGVSEEEALHLFEMKSDSASSTGLGLYLTRMLAEQNQLSLVYALVDGHSRFSIVFSPGVTVMGMPSV